MDYGKLLAPQRRAEWTLDELLKRESVYKDSPIRALYERWKQGIQLTPADHVVITEGENPTNWMIHDHNDRLAQNWCSKRLRDYPIPEHGIRCAFEYLTALRENRPVCHVISQDFERLKRKYARIVLPTEGRLVYTFRRLGE